MLCAVCEAILWRPLPEQQEPYKEVASGPHQSSLKELSISANLKCRICGPAALRLDSSLVQPLEYWSTRYTISEKDTIVPLSNPSGQGGIDSHITQIPQLELYLQLEEPKENGGPVLHHLAQFALVATSHPSFGSSNYIPSRESNTSSCFSLVRHWLEECSQKHEICKVGRHDWVPSRLIHLKCDNANIALNLECFSANIGRQRYTSLSHCWGTGDVPRLLHNNIHQAEANISFDSLPKTFKDAVIITKRIGLEYIWIDSLCIIQDSHDDWASEAAMMGNVYKRSFLNISAAGATNSSGGCFFSRDPSLITPYVVSMLRHIRQANISSEGTRVPYYLIALLPSVKQHLESAQLHSRAWVFQERLLAPRVLHFDQSQLFWECQSVEACESFPCGYPFHNGTGRKRLLQLSSAQLPPAPHIFIPSPVADDLQMLPNVPKAVLHWARLVEVYSRCALTVPTDKLIAISGIASEMRPMLGGSTYLAGMWSRGLPFEMLWRARSTCQRYNGEYRSPSWSWAAVDGAVSYEDCLDVYSCHFSSRPAQFLCAIHNVKVGGLRASHGLLTFATLTISGKLGLAIYERIKVVDTRAKRRPAFVEWDWIWDFQTVRLWDGSQDGEDEKSAGKEVEVQERQGGNYRSSVTGRADIAWDDHSESLFFLGKRIFLLPLLFIGMKGRGPHTLPGQRDMMGLVLRSSSKNTFTRLGTFRCQDMEINAAFDMLNEHEISLK